MVSPAPVEESASTIAQSFMVGSTVFSRTVSHKCFGILCPGKIINHSLLRKLPAHTRALSLSLSLSLSRTHTHTHTHSHTHIHIHTDTLKHTHKHIHIHRQTH